MPFKLAEYFLFFGLLPVLTTIFLNYWIPAGQADIALSFLNNRDP